MDDHPDRLLAVRSLYLGVLASGVLFCLLIWWCIPVQNRKAAEAKPKAAVRTVRLSAPMPAAGLGPGAEVVAFFPQASLSRKASRLESKGGQLIVEFEVPETSDASAPAEMWMSSGSVRWHLNPSGQLQLADLPGGKLRDTESFKYPGATARMPKNPPKTPDAPEGVKLPSGVKQLSSQELDRLRASYRARR